MIKAKSIIKRSIAVLLAMLTLMSVGLTNIIALNVELAETAWSFSGGYIYFDNSKTDWDATYVYLVIGKGSYSSVYQMTKIGNTKLYYKDLPTSGWSDASYMAFMASTTSWSSDFWGPDNIKNASVGRTGTYTTSTSFVSNNYYLGVPSSGDNDSSLSISGIGTAYGSALNKSHSAYAYSNANSSSGYSEDVNAGTVKITGYYLDSKNSSASREKESELGTSAVATGTFARTSEITLTATVADGYTFKGWSTDKTTTFSSDPEITRTVGTESVSYYALFEKAASTVTVNTAANGTVDKSGEIEVDSGESITITATPNTNYEFNGWTVEPESAVTFENDTSKSDATIIITPSADVTLTPSFEKITYELTLNCDPEAAGSASVTSSPNPVPYGEPATIAVTQVNRGYKFLGWYKGEEMVSEQLEYTISGVFESLYYTAKFETLPERTLTITNNKAPSSAYSKVTLGETSYTINSKTFTQTFYDGETITIELCSPNYNYVSGLYINGDTETNYAYNTNYFPDDTWAFNKTYTISGNLTLDFTHSDNPELHADNPANGTITVGQTGIVSHNHSYSVTVEVTNSDYYITKVYEVDSNGVQIGEALYSGADASMSKWEGSTTPIRQTTTIKADFALKAFNYITVTGEDNNGNSIADISFSLVSKSETLTATDNGTYKVEQGSTVTITASENTNSEYYISAIKYDGVEKYTNTDETDLDASAELTASAKDSSSIVIVYTKRPTYEVKVVNTDSNMGSLDKSTKSDFYKNSVYTITPTAKGNYAFGSWTVTPSDATYTVNPSDNSITVNVDGKYESVTVTANWVRKSTYTVTLMAPSSMGYATATGTGIDIDTKSSTDKLNKAEVNPDTTITLTAAGWDSSYKASPYTIEGNFNTVVDFNAETGTMQIIPTGDVTITANFEQGSVKFYVLKPSTGWTKVWVNTNQYKEGEWRDLTETKQVTINGVTKTVYVGEMSANTEWIQFNTTNNNNNRWQITGKPNLLTYGNFMDLTVSKDNDDSNHEGWGFLNVSSANAPETYDIVGGVTLDLEDYGDGIHIGSYKVDAGTASITVNIKGSNGGYYNYLSAGAESNSANVTPSANDGDKVTIDFGTNSDGVTVNFFFDKANEVLSWTYVQMKPTVKVIADYGMLQNEADASEGSFIGNVYFEKNPEVVYSFEAEDDGEAIIAKDTTVIFYTQVATNNHYVEGWVINGTKFVKANSNGDGLYYASYKFTEAENRIIPVYFHTQDWLTSRDSSTVTVYALQDTKNDRTTPDTEIVGWQDYMSAYTWFYTADSTSSNMNNIYKQFGDWVGQVMIPVGDDTHLYKTYVEKTAPLSDESKRIGVSGITFTNDYKNHGTGSWFQTYDYYEFVSLIEDNKFNITFVLKNTNSNSNAGRNENNSASINIKNTTKKYNWVDYVDYSGYTMDIYRTLHKDRTTTTDDNALYIVRRGPYNKWGTGNLQGQYFVDAYIYDSAGNKIDSCVSYELVDLESDFFTTLKNYATSKGYSEDYYRGGNVYVSYETYNNPRYDGEWYGDDNDTTLLDVSARIAFKATDGTITVYPDLNQNEMGTATINDAKDAKVTRGTPAKFVASEVPGGGYKFIGWYKSTGSGDTLVTTDILNESAQFDMEIGIGGETYIALYRERTADDFAVSNLMYNGLSPRPEEPSAHLGASYRYVSVKQYRNNVLIADHPKTEESITFNPQEDDVLEITIYTKAMYPKDYFFAWYTEVWADNKIVNFEEVQVSEENRGQNGEVKFTFTYVVKNNDSGVNIYSDIYHEDITKNIVYQYIDRYGNSKQYVKLRYTLTSDSELKNGYPDYASVLKYAPYIDDLYKDAEWIYDDTDTSMFDVTEWKLTAKQEKTRYTVTAHIGEDEVEHFTGEYNTPIEILATKYDTKATNNGYWYTIENGEERILAHGAYYGLVLTEDLDIYYKYDTKENLELKFNVVLSEPVYGREQSGENGAVDKIYVDYLANINVPLFTGDKTPDGTTITENKYKDEVIISANSPVTLETLEDYDYSIEHGIITEQVGTFKVDEDGTYKTFEAALNAAELEGYMEATSQENLELVVKSTQSAGWGESFGINGFKAGDRDEYYTVYDLSNGDITNKNRYPYTLIFNNSVSTRGRFYNVYAYVAVTYNNETKYYFSNMQTLNTYYAGTYIIDSNGNIVDVDGNIVDSNGNILN